MSIIALILTLIQLMMVFFIRWQFKNDLKRVLALEQIRSRSPKEENDLTRLRFRISLYKRRVNMLFVLAVCTGLTAVVFGYIELTAEHYKY